MQKVFISYSSKNQKLVEAFIEFLQLGMGMRKSDIFCTAYPGMLETGKGFIERIRMQLRECDVVISLITEEYLKSTFCLVEMGAAWALSKSYFPLVSVPFDRLNGTPLQGMQMRKLDDASHLSVIYDELHKCGVLDEHDTAEFTRRVQAFVLQVGKLIKSDDRLKPDEEGYYETEIVSVRKLPEKYRCYGIRGQIADAPDGEEADSDWLFFWSGTFPDLHPGDRVRFKMSKSEVRKFSDLGKARNIYLDDLSIVK